MLRDELFPLSAQTPPEDDDRAMQRMSNLMAKGTDLLCNLVMSVYRDKDQIRRTLRELQFSTEESKIADSGRFKTWKLKAIAVADGATFGIIVNECAGHWAQVVNCWLMKPGRDMDPEILHGYRDATRD